MPLSSADNRCRSRSGPIMVAEVQIGEPTVLVACSPKTGPRDLYPCCRSTVVRVEGRVIIRRSHAPYVFGDGAPANRFPAAIGRNGRCGVGGCPPGNALRIQRCLQPAVSSRRLLSGFCGFRESLSILGDELQKVLGGM